MTEQLTYFLEQNPSVAKVICENQFLPKEQGKLPDMQGILQEERLRLTDLSFRENLQIVRIRTHHIVKYLS